MSITVSGLPCIHCVYSGYLEEPAILEGFVFVTVLSFYTKMFQLILPFFSPLHVFSFSQGFLSVGRFFPLTALAMHSELTLTMPAHY